MANLKFENYIYYPDRIIKFDELNDHEKNEFRKGMIRILEEQTNLVCIEKGAHKTNKRLEDGENIPNTKKEV
ncbi:hypothetical protein [Anaerosporobacter sp.]